MKTSDNSTVASVSVSMTGATEGAFKYQNLPVPVTLSAFTSYYIVSQEFLGGDSWFDSSSTVLGTSVATINAAVSSPDGVTGWNVGATPGRSYGLLDFQYDLVAPDTTQSSRTIEGTTTSLISSRLGATSSSPSTPTVTSPETCRARRATSV